MVATGGQFFRARFLEQQFFDITAEGLQVIESYRAGLRLVEVGAWCYLGKQVAQGIQRAGFWMDGDLVFFLFSIAEEARHPEAS